MGIKKTHFEGKINNYLKAFSIISDRQSTLKDLYFILVHYFPILMMQYVLAGSLHKNNTSH